MEIAADPKLALPEHFPSLSVCLEQCIHFERQPVSGPAAQRGTRIHHYIFGVLTGIFPFAEVPRSYRKAVIRAANCAQEIGGELLLAEEEIPAQLGETIISCMPDFVLESAEGITAINWKTGHERDYRIAQRFYTVALCQRYQVAEIAIVECYVDLNYAKSYRLKFDRSLECAQQLLHRFESRNAELAQNCEYCRWCALGPTGNRSCAVGCAELAMT
ncbi:MAG: hypothetical protein DMG76_23680 [Acidobacteria bacterium]|nr:MAG: hypothetical protein DMG76_23680 [Acidobacteriota bacterium]